MLDKNFIIEELTRLIYLVPKNEEQRKSIDNAIENLRHTLMLALEN